MKNQKAITLVALTITVIILLVLVTVSINLVMNGGIIDKSKSAVDKYSEAEIGEQIKQAYLEYEMAKLTRTNLSLKDYMKQSLERTYGEGKVSVTPNSETEDFPLLIGINGKEYLFNADGTSRRKYGIDEYDVAKHPETYYGHYVTNYNSPNDAGIQDANGQLGKWQIFMADDTNIYLIASNYITRKYTGTKNGVGFDYDTTNKTEETATQMWFSSIIGQYNANSTTTDIPQILSRLNKQSIYHKWMNNLDNQKRNYNNEKAVAAILDVDLWSGFNNSTYAMYSIGSPSIEMICKSYNDIHKEGQIEAKETNNENNYGYRIKKGDDEAQNSISGLTDCDNKLYFKYTSKGRYCWLASPNSLNSNNLFRMTSTGALSQEIYSSKDLGFRPLVCLKSNVHLVLNEDGQTYSLEVN